MPRSTPNLPLLAGTIGGGVVVILLGLLLVGGVKQVDSTEHCVLTRYGKVVDRKMSTGLNFTPFADATCFTMTETNFPVEGVESMEAQTGDPVTVQGDVALIYAYDPATVFDVFMEKRSPAAAEAEILNATREGYRTALSNWTVAEIFSGRRQFLSGSVRAHIQRKLGDRAQIKQVFVRDIKIPASIEQQRIAAAEQAQILDRARKQFVIDSVNANAIVFKAEAEAKSKELQARSYESNNALIELDKTRALAEGISNACKGVTTCVIGGSIMDVWDRQ